LRRCRDSHPCWQAIRLSNSPDRQAAMPSPWPGDSDDGYISLAFDVTHRTLLWQSSSFLAQTVIGSTVVGTLDSSAVSSLGSRGRRNRGPRENPVDDYVETHGAAGHRRTREREKTITRTASRAAEEGRPAIRHARSKPRPAW
jgi:hypothetical protein